MDIRQTREKQRGSYLEFGKLKHDNEDEFTIIDNEDEFTIIDDDDEFTITSDDEWTFVENPEYEARALQTYHTVSSPVSTCSNSICGESKPLHCGFS